MKKLIMFAAVISVSLFCGTAQAEIWRINNDPEAKANFLSINDAMASESVVKGDILYLDPGCSLPSQTVTKEVTILGTGFNLPEARDAKVESITMKCANGKITGVNVTGTISVSAKNVTVERCRARGISVGSEASKIINCYVVGWVDHSSYALHSFVSNNIIVGQVKGLYNSTFSNNVVIFEGEYYDWLLSSVNNTTVSNNVLINTSSKYSSQTIANTSISYGNNIVNNVLSTDAVNAWADYPDNKFIGAKLKDVFVCEGGEEAKFHLKQGSPALKAGTNGWDCGVFSGQFPYVLNGRPKFVPYIYHAEIPSAATNGKLNITLKIKSQND